MKCDFERRGAQFVCRVCGRIATGATAPRAMCPQPAPGVPPAPATILPAAPPVPLARVSRYGHALHDLLASIGLGEACAACSELRRKMDAWGEAGCALHREEILAALRERGKGVPLRTKARAFAAAAARGLWVSPRDPAASLLDHALRLARQSGARDRLVFVVGHEAARLSQIAAAAHLRKVFLPGLRPTLPLALPPSQLAENQIYTSDLLQECDREYIGIAAASWNDKYLGRVWKGVPTPHCLPLERLGELPLSPRIVWAAHKFTEDPFLGGLGRFVPGLLELVDLALAHLGASRPADGAWSLLASNFLAHRDVVRDLRNWQRRAIGYLDRRYGGRWPLACEVDFAECTCRLPAYVGEALAICYFAQRSDLQIRQIPSPLEQ